MIPNIPTRHPHAGLCAGRCGFEAEPGDGGAHQARVRREDPARHQGVGDAGRVSDDARRARWHDGKRRVRGAARTRGVRQGGARLRAGLHASRDRKPHRHCRPHLLQLAGADRPLPADREAQARRSRSASASIRATRTRRWAERSTTRVRPTRASARSRANSTSCRGRTSTSSTCTRCASRCTTARSS